MLAALFATSVAALATSAGLFGTDDPGKHVSDVPEVRRTLVQRAIVQPPEWRHFQSLAYSRRADELQRLRELPAAPARAVVEYAERAQAKAADGAPPETSGASTHPATESIAVASAPAGPPSGSAPASDAAAAATATIQTATQPLPPPDAEAPRPTSGDTDLASVQSGTEAIETGNAPDQRKLIAEGRHGLKARVRRPPRIVAMPRSILPAARTGFPIDAPPDPPKTPAQARASAAANTAVQTLNTEPMPDTRVEAGR